MNSILALHLKTKRGERSLRDVASELGLSASTLSRAENGLLQDMETFGKLCGWLGLDANVMLGIREATAKACTCAHCTREKEAYTRGLAEGRKKALQDAAVRIKRYACSVGPSTEAMEMWDLGDSIERDEMGQP
jgi:transcriptional regulator with XRE-family HTH domain